jgi:hypothetical protein
VTTLSREEVAQELERILYKFVFRKASLSEDPWLFHDLDIRSDDAVELFDEIHARFGTRFDEMDWHSYFPADMDAVGEKCAVRLGFPPIPCTPLPLKHLVDVVVAGAWFDPPPMRDLRSSV